MFTIFKYFDSLHQAGFYLQRLIPHPYCPHRNGNDYSIGSFLYPSICAEGKAIWVYNQHLFLLKTYFNQRSNGHFETLISLSILLSSLCIYLTSLSILWWFATLEWMAINLNYIISECWYGCYQTKV